jgi:4-phospho-D-threonate 3-dehydrogenase / 4-phospho-D-erythronate 3-dehydrogenase
VKTRGFERSVSVTFGCPFLRTSVEHRTAFDIEGTCKASAVSMVEAARTVTRYAPRYRENAQK